MIRLQLFGYCWPIWHFCLRMIRMMMKRLWCSMYLIHLWSSISLHPALEFYDAVVARNCFHLKWMEMAEKSMTLEMTTILMYTLRKCYSSLKYSNEFNYTPALLIMKSISLGSRRFLGNPYAGISVSSSSSSSSSSSEIYLFFFEYL